MEIYKASVFIKGEIVTSLYVAKTKEGYEEILTKRILPVYNRNNNWGLKIEHIVDNSDRTFYKYLVQDLKEINELLNNINNMVMKESKTPTITRWNKFVNEIRLNLFTRIIHNKFMKALQNEFYNTTNS